MANNEELEQINPFLATIEQQQEATREKIEAGVPLTMAEPSTSPITEPAGKPVGILSDKDYRKQTQADLEKAEELRTQIGEVESKIKELQAAKAAVEAGYEVTAPGEKKDYTPDEQDEFDIEEPEEDPEVTALKEQITTLENQFNDTWNKLSTFQAKSDVATANLIQSVKDAYDAREAALKESNRRAVQQIKTYGIRFGTARFSPNSFVGIVTAQENAGIMKLAELDAEEAQLIASIQQAADEKEYDRLHDQLTMLDNRRKEKADVVKELQDLTKEENEKVQERLRKVSVQGAITGLMQYGITDPLKLFDFLNYDESGNIIGDVEMSEITEILDATLQQQDEEYATGAIGEYQRLKDMGELPEDIGFFEFNQLLADSKRAPDTTVTREDLTPFEKLAARNLSVQIFGKRAGTKPENVGLIEDLLAGGMSVDDISDNLRYEQQSTEMQGYIRDAAESVANGLASAASREFFLNSLDRSLEDGDMDRVRELMKMTAIDTYDSTTAKVIRGADRALSLVDEIEMDLRNFEAKGGNTGILEGTEEEVLNKIGETKDPELAALANKIRMAVQRYRHDISGAAFTEAEAKEYRQVFPSIKKTSSFNSASIASLRQVLSGDVGYYVSNRIGKSAYEQLFIGSPIYSTPSPTGQTGFNEEVNNYLSELGL